MKAFKITGTFQMGRNRQDFIKETVADDKSSATEKLLSELGSKHNVKRYQIDISDIKELKPEEVSDPVIQYALGIAPKEG